MLNLTHTILGCSFEVINELGVGFLETVYKNSLGIALKENGLRVEEERCFKIHFRGKQVGLYRADLIVNNCVIIETKCCSSLLPEHQAQLINYLKAASMPVGLLINFGNKSLDYKRVHYPTE